MADFDQEIERLFELPPEEFTAARNELAKRLKTEGEPSASEQVKQLGKPTVAAWTINQLARQDKDSIRALVAAGAKLRQAQEQALKGDAGDGLRQAQEEERRALRTLTQRAHEILEAVGRPASRAVLDQISSSLRVAALTEDGAAALEAGRLSGEVKASGFDALVGMEVGERAPAPKGRRRAAPPRDELAERRREKREREQRRRELRERARKLDAQAREAEREAERAERAAAAARTAAEKSRGRADDAARKLGELD